MDELRGRHRRQGLAVRGRGFEPGDGDHGVVVAPAQQGGVIALFVEGDHPDLAVWGQVVIGLGDEHREYFVQVAVGGPIDRQGRGPVEQTVLGHAPHAGVLGAMAGPPPIDSAP